MLLLGSLKQLYDLIDLFSIIRISIRKLKIMVPSRLHQARASRQEKYLKSTIRHHLRPKVLAMTLAQLRFLSAFV